MPKRASKPLTIAPLQYVVGEPITDPAEQAAIDEMRQRVRGKKGKAKGDGKGAKSNAAPKKK